MVYYLYFTTTEEHLEQAYFHLFMSKFRLSVSKFVEILTQCLEISLNFDIISRNFEIQAEILSLIVGRNFNTKLRVTVQNFSQYLIRKVYPQYENIGIFHGCVVWIEKSVTRVTDRHHEACRVMPNSDPE